MYRWGHIRRFRFDNGRPFGTPTLDGVSPCAVVLAALDCEVTFNQPRSPTQNAKVERNQGTIARWADIKQCASLAEFQQALDRAVVDQRENYPTRVCQGRTRIATYPTLQSNSRRYDGQNFDASRAYRFIATYHFARIVSTNGQVSLLGHRYQVGGQHRGKKVVVNLATKMNVPVWNFRDQANHTIARLVARQLATTQYIKEVWKIA